MAWRGALGSVAMSVAVAAASAGWPADAHACGGTFCDAGRGIPVDQSAETILFSMADGVVDVQIQISYTGDPDRFAWIVPVPAVPDFAPGDQALFDALDLASARTYGLERTSADCEAQEEEAEEQDDEGGMGCGGGFSLGFGSPSVDQPDDDPPMRDDNNVLHHELVGAFEIVVLEATSAIELDSWLDGNGYATDDAAIPIIEEYLAEGNVFAAVKLRPGAGIDEIHPIRMTFAGDEPCIPLRLTRIAAVADMPVRALFLGEHRTAAANYRMVDLNPVRIDWTRNGDNYESVLTQAVDGEAAEGRAFHTEFAGPHGLLRSFVDIRWDTDAFLNVQPQQVPAVLEQQGVLACNDDGCEYRHPMIEALLDEFLPPPRWVSAAAFWNCVSCYEDTASFDDWDGEAFAEQFSERIIEPAAHAEDLLARWPYLTRLYTRISPEEMTEDPVFVQNPDLPEVARAQRAHLEQRCDGVDVLTLPDGRQLGLVPGAPWPVFPGLPAAEFVSVTTDRGAPVIEIEYAELTDDLVIERNRVTLEETGASQEAIAIEWGGGIDEPEDEGCGGCRLPGGRQAGDGPLWMALLFGFAWLRRRI